MNNYEVSQELTQFIADYEAIHDGDGKRVGLQPKLCAANKWTEGYGHVMIVNGKQATISDFPTLNSIMPYSTISTVEMAILLLKEDIEIRAKKVRRDLKIQVSQNKFDALVSHRFNCGYSQTLYRLINDRENPQSIRDWFITKYITANGVKLAGLQCRRNDEAEMYFFSDYNRDYYKNFTKLRESKR